MENYKIQCGLNLEDMLPVHQGLPALYYCNDSRKEGCIFYHKLQIDTEYIKLTKSLCLFSSKKDGKTANQGRS